MIINLLIILLVVFILFIFIKNYCKHYNYTELFTKRLNIIQTWKNKQNIPSKYKYLINKVRKLHPNANYMFFTDDDIDNFIKTKFSKYLSTYNNFKHKIEKIDFSFGFFQI